MESTATIISAMIAVIAAIVAIWTIAKTYLKVKNSKNITLTKKDRSKQITINRSYTKEDSKRLIEFMK